MPHLLRRHPCPLTLLENCHDTRPCFPCFRKSAFPPGRAVRLRAVAQSGPPCGARAAAGRAAAVPGRNRAGRSEEHTSELQSLMRISYAVFCLKKKKKQKKNIKPTAIHEPKDASPKYHNTNRHK